MTAEHYYASDDDGGCRSPGMTPKRPNLRPSPSPTRSAPASKVGSPAPPESRRGNNRASQGDAVLINYLSGGRLPDVAQRAGEEALPSIDDAEAARAGGIEVFSAPSDYVALASSALRQLNEPSPASIKKEITTTAPAPPIIHQPTSHDRRYGQSNGRLPDASSHHPSAPGSQEPKRSPTAFTSLQSLGDLPPIQPHSPSADQTTNLTLPSINSIHSQLGDFNHKADGGLDDARRPFPGHSPCLPPLTSHGIPVSHTSPPPPPPKSLNDYRRELPSPGRANMAGGVYPYRRMSPDGGPYATPETTIATPSTVTDQPTPVGLHHPPTPVSTTALTPGVDRMSIDGITNPQVGAFKCNYPDCTAPPFQTQYLLNSHANVHSSNRPHYCSVKGCPRSEGGKGFKRKNEMIRHGLVHESPGYVCPFCEGDREHKYPRPDNLQRHVRVHHVDKSKDDPLLRDVLAQRPEGPSRGRRRRGGTH